ncbi:glycine cleavage system protein GcvH [Syntrophomonas erecta]
MNIPKDLKYSTEHEWIRLEGTRAYLGITDFAQHNLGDIVYVEIPEVDNEVANGESVAVIESVKAVSSVYTPMSGTIAEANEDLESSPELLNEDPYENWLAIIEVSNPDEIEDLMSSEEYERFCKEQENA